MAEKCFKGMSGAHAAMFTPFDAKGRVNPEMIAKIMDYGYANGLKGFYLTGTTGEWWLLSLEERKQVLAAAVASNKGRGKLIAHVGANRTDDSVELARYAAEIGIDWVSSIAPQLYRTSFDATLYHYRKIAEATDLPFMVYSMGAALVPERDIRFFDLKNVKGIKYTGRDYYAAQRLKRVLDKSKETIWFAGCDEQLLCGLALGNVFAGGIGTSYNIIPKHIAMICEYAAKNDFRTAAKWQDETNRLIELMIESDNWSYRKAMMRFIGLDCGPYRKPFEPLTAAQYKAFAKRFAALN
ncbi:MAG TPA: dihydrodipicolinate synthase family protein, partial [Kiritimatiellia bacterium]|nr:dihydrodipicolinate synthase family protein [Kiritimatiellia bacterium]